VRRQPGPPALSSPRQPSKTHAGQRANRPVPGLQICPHDKQKAFCMATGPCRAEAKAKALPGMRAWFPGTVVCASPEAAMAAVKATMQLFLATRQASLASPAGSLQVAAE
jgi:hypothetical protein